MLPLLKAHSNAVDFEDGKMVMRFSPWVLPSCSKSNWQLVFCKNLTYGLWFDGILASTIGKYSRNMYGNMF